jgi:threonylcarbamoyladenosine tRNA methylthiotransferase MtaB
VRPEEKHCRSQQVLKVSEAHTRAFYNKYIGGVRPVLLERGKKKGVMGGFTDNYIKVELTSSQLDNTIVNVRLGDWNEKGDALMGELIMDN